jgi:transcriptional regulator with XRE-family HTH domain
MTIHEKLKAARLKKGLSVREAARLLGYKNHRTITSWENGERTPKLENRKRLAELYDVDIIEFLLDD